MPRQTGVAQAFALAEAKLREEIAQAEAAVERAQEKSATAGSRLEELLRVKELVGGVGPVAKSAVQSKARKAARPKAKRAAKRTPGGAGGFPGSGTATRAVFDAVAAGARSYQSIREQTGFPGAKWP